MYQGNFNSFFFLLEGAGKLTKIEICSRGFQRKTAFQVSESISFLQVPLLKEFMDPYYT